MDLKKFIEENGISAEIVSFDRETKTARDAEKLVGGSVAKSIVIVRRNDPNDCALVILRGRDKINMKKFPGFRLASASEVEACSGYKVGTVPPVGTKIKNVVIDKDLGGVVYCGGGSERSLLKISVEEIKRATNAKVDKISKSVHF